MEPTSVPLRQGHRIVPSRVSSPKALRRRASMRPGRSSVWCCASLEDSFAGRLFGPSQEALPWWDQKCLFHPIVLTHPSSWRMYYYGRPTDSWHSGVKPALLSTGRIGLALSKDGLNWSRAPGPLPHGAIMDPRDGRPSAFDSVHVGCSDVFFHRGEWWMYYFGGGLETISLPHGGGGRTVTGMRLRTGLSKSSLDGVHGFDEIREEEPVLDVGAPGEWDEMMVAWARVIPPSSTHSSSHWLMTYSSMDMTTTSFPSFAIGVAISQDGRKWSKVGKVLERGEPGSWDDAGVSRRHVIFHEGQFLMFYEGANKGGTHAIGLATSKDGITWVKDKHGFGGQPGGPIFSPKAQEKEAWDSGGVASPHVVKIDDSIWLYYVGFDITKKISAFGLASSDGNNFRSFRRIKFYGA